jgi:leucyl-tRNA synthetase
MTYDMEHYKYNTAVSKLMVLVNAIYEAGSLAQDQYVLLLQMLAPFAPTMTQEKWKLLGMP